MKFSIVTPSYNQGRFIRDCIESVRGQEGVEWEHLIIDACSTDETIGILRSYPHLQWVSEPDQGQTDAINKGFRKATGDWLMWLNADDYLLPGALRRMQEFAHNHSAADVIYGDCLFVDESKNVQRKRPGFNFNFNMLLFYGCFIPSTATFYRHAILNGGHLLNPLYRRCMDYEYYLRLAQAGYSFVHLAEPLACFRWHGNNISLTSNEHWLGETRVIQREYLERHGLSWLGHEWTLRLLFRAYQARRLFLRFVRWLGRRP